MAADGNRENPVIIALGANLSDPLQTCENAVAALEASGRISVLARSGYYLTEPVGYADQPWYVNAVVLARTGLSPVLLLSVLKDLERAFGRSVPGFRNGPRELDLDIIFFSDRVIEEPELSIPHPRMQERAFVLQPLAEIAADWVHPVYQKSVRRLLADLGGAHEACIPVTAACN